MPRSAPPSQPTLTVDDLLRLIDSQMQVKKIKPSWESQEITFDAMEAPTARKQMSLLMEALRLDGGNVDALQMILAHVRMTDEQRLTLLRQIVRLGEHRLGKRFFDDAAGEFWLHLEARPYMRARAWLAQELYDAGSIDEAIPEWETMMTLNSNDNQGLRYMLLCAYYERSRLDDAARLVAKGDSSEYSTVFAWCKVLDCLLRGDDNAAAVALQSARQQNPHTEAYLTGRKGLPKELPGGYSPGDESEAAAFADMLLQAWLAHPAAMAWLTDHGVNRKSPKAPELKPKRGRRK